MNENIIIVGASAAGISAAKEIRRNNSDVRITLLSDEKIYPYYRPYLTEYIADKKITARPNFALNPESWYEENRIDLNLGVRAVKIYPFEKKVVCDNDKEYEFGKLILSNGSASNIPVKGALLKENVFAVKTIADADALSYYADRSKSAILVGGGPLGLEAADSLVKKNLKVSLIEKSERILPRLLDEEGSEIYHMVIKDRGIEVLYDTGIDSLMGDDRAAGVKLTDGREILADMIIFSAGIVPNAGMAADCGIKTSTGILVNDRMETSVKDIYACGDCAEFNGRLNALWMRAVKQGKTAGSSASGGNERFIEEDYPTVVNSLGTHLFCTGFIGEAGTGVEYTEYKAVDAGKRMFKKLYFIDNRLAGAIIIGESRLMGRVMSAVKDRADYNKAIELIN